MKRPRDERASAVLIRGCPPFECDACDTGLWIAARAIHNAVGLREAQEERMSKGRMEAFTDGSVSVWIIPDLRLERALTR